MKTKTIMFALFYLICTDLVYGQSTYQTIEHLRTFKNEIDTVVSTELKGEALKKYNKFINDRLSVSIEKLKEIDWTDKASYRKIRRIKKEFKIFYNANMGYLSTNKLSQESLDKISKGYDRINDILTDEYLKERELNATPKVTNPAFDRFSE